MIRLVALVFVVWVVGVIVMREGGPRHVVAELTLPHVVH